MPRDALVIRQNRSYVLRVTRSNTVEQLDVTPGVGMADRAAGMLFAELGFPEVDATTAEGGTVEANPTAGELCAVEVNGLIRELRADEAHIASEFGVGEITAVEDDFGEVEG